MLDLKTWSRLTTLLILSHWALDQVQHKYSSQLDDSEIAYSLVLQQDDQVFGDGLAANRVSPSSVATGHGDVLLVATCWCPGASSCEEFSQVLSLFRKGGWDRGKESSINSVTTRTQYPWLPQTLNLHTCPIAIWGQCG